MRKYLKFPSFFRGIVLISAGGLGRSSYSPRRVSPDGFVGSPGMTAALTVAGMIHAVEISWPLGPLLERATDEV